MQFSLTTRHTEISDEIRDFAEKRVRQLEHFSPWIISCHLIIDTERKNFLAEINVNIGRHQINCRAKHRDVHAAIEGVIKKIEKRLRKLKTRFEKRRKRKSLPEPIPSEVSEDAHELIKGKNFSLKL